MRAILAALPLDLPLDERTTTEQHARKIWRETKAGQDPRSRWFIRETLRIIGSDPSHPLYRAAGRTLERMAVDDRHR